jgi:hypothetical protein
VTIEGQAPSPSHGRATATIQEEPEAQWKGRELDAFLSLDLAPERVADARAPTVSLAYAIAYDLKKSIYSPIKEWVAPSDRFYLTSEHKVEKLNLRRDHSDAVAAIASLALLAAPGPKGIAASELAVAGAPFRFSVPTAGGTMVRIPGRLPAADLAQLQKAYGVEFAQIYLTGPGKGGGGGQYLLIRGTAKNVSIPLGPNVRFISHSHPEKIGSFTVPLRASTDDQNVLRLLQKAGSPQQTSQVVPEVGQPFRFDTTTTRK